MNILVADDDPDFGALLRALLEHFGHRPTIVEDGEAALAEYARSFYPVVITDWMMPGIDGLELTRRLRARRERRYPWIMMLTVRDFGANYAATMEAGVDDFLSKPIDSALLEARLRVAERVQGMIARVGELESLLPICMVCKSVRNQENSWQRIETYLHEHARMGFSHGYCPECYYDKQLGPDLVALRHLRLRTTPPRLVSGLDPAAVAALRQFAAEHAHGLIEDLVDVYSEATGRELHLLVEQLEQDGQITSSEGKRLERLRQQCWDLGALRLHNLLDPEALRSSATGRTERLGTLSEIRAELAAVDAAVADLVP